MKRFGSLLLALLAGFLIAAVLDRREATSAGTPVGPAPRSAATDVPSSEGDAFAEAWRLLAERDLTLSQRRDAQKTLLNAWASADPRHLMRFVEGRAVPHGWEDCLRVIADAHPELVIQFARNHGSLKALRLLVDRMDPRAALGALAAEPGMPPDLFATVARRGTATDPDFVQRVTELPEGPAREQFLSGAIQTQLSMSRWDDACDLALQLHEEKGRVAVLLGGYLADLPEWEERNERLLGLPDELRGPVLATLVEKLAIRAEEPSDFRDLKAFAEELAGENDDEGLARVLERMAPAARVEVERVLAEPPATDASAE